MGYPSRFDGSSRRQCAHLGPLATIILLCPTQLAIQSALLRQKWYYDQWVTSNLIIYILPLLISIYGQFDEYTPILCILSMVHVISRLTSSYVLINLIEYISCLIYQAFIDSIVFSNLLIQTVRDIQLYSSTIFVYNPRIDNIHGIVGVSLPCFYYHIFYSINSRLWHSKSISCITIQVGLLSSINLNIPCPSLS